jgi:hypothetical protein
MSFDIFLTCLNNAGVMTFKRQLAEEVLGREAVRPEKVLLGGVEYPDRSGSAVYCSEGEDLGHLMFNHSGGDMFFERLWELADRSGSMIYWPGYGFPRAVTRPEMLQHLPKDLEDIEPPPFVVRNGRELVDAMNRTS